MSQRGRKRTRTVTSSMSPTLPSIAEGKESGSRQSTQPTVDDPVDLSDLSDDPIDLTDDSKDDVADSAADPLEFSGPTFPYPFSGVSFRYAVPTVPLLLALQVDCQSIESRERAIRYLTDYLNPRLRSDQSFLVYPCVGSSDSDPVGSSEHNNFLYWVKMFRYIDRNPSIRDTLRSQGDSSMDGFRITDLPFERFYPGNPQQWWQHLWHLVANPSEWGPTSIQFQPVPSGVRYLDSSESKLTNRQSQRLLSGSRLDYLALDHRYPTRQSAQSTSSSIGSSSSLSSSPTPIASSSSSPTFSRRYNYHYCGNLPEAWELGSEQGWAGSFSRCKDQFDRQVSLLNKWTSGTDRSDPSELLTTPSIQVETLQQEVEAMQWLARLLSAR